MKLPSGPFTAIAADPPWMFKDQGTRLAPGYKGKQRRDKDKKHYAVLSLTEICQLPVKACAADNAYLFLWIPAALRESPYYFVGDHWAAGMYTQRKQDCDGARYGGGGVGFHRAVMRAWGFTPTGAEIIWVKGRVPPVKVRPSADVVEVQPQLTLQIGGGHTVRNAHEVCVIGRRGKPQRLDKGVPSVIVESRGRHSTKPEAFYALVERLCAGPYLDLYGRTVRDKWVVWGDQVGQ